MKTPIEWLGNKMRVLDQTLLPGEEVYLDFTDYHQVAEAIKTLRIRGAPAIGVAAAYGVALGAESIKLQDLSDFKNELHHVIEVLAATRPTARNLFQALELMEGVTERARDISGLKQQLIDEAAAIHSKQREADQKLSENGASLIGPDASLITHCNTGPLATAGYGTALGIIIEAFRRGRVNIVYPTETRPLCQGARLTTWELKQAGVPFKLITDSMAGYVMQTRHIDAVIVGADRIAINGDTANKIGTYQLAVLAKEHGVPFFIAAPTSTIDTLAKTGKDIPIEERCEDEVTCYSGLPVTPKGTQALNPAFDVTPFRYITAIITEKGVIRETGELESILYHH